MRMAKRSIAVVSAAALVWFSGLAQGQGVKTLLTVEKDDLASFVSSPKDAGLKQALGMVPARLRELPGEARGARADDIELALSLVNMLARPGRLAVVYDAGYPAGGFLGYGIIASVKLNGEQDVAALEARIDEALGRANLPEPPRPSERFPSMREVSVPPVGVVAFGKRKADDGWRYEIVAGAVDSLDPVMKAFPPLKAEGWTRTLLGSFDLSGLTPAANFVQQMAGNNPEATEAIEGMTEAGMLGPGAARGTIEVGHTATHGLTRLTIANGREHAGAWGLPTEPITRAELDAVPADAVLASISRADLSAFDRMIDEASKQGPQLQEALDRFKEETGVDLRRDLLGALGGTGIAYTSRTTGGGGLGSLVLLSSFKDRERFLQAHDRLVKHAAGLIEQRHERAARYIRFRSWEQDGVRLHTLSARGLPVPIDFTYAATDRWLIAGLLPQAVFEAMGHVTGAGGEGLSQSPLVKDAWREGRPVTSLVVMDPSALVGKGYPITSMLGSAIAAGVRSPSGERDIEVIVPTFRALTEGMQPYSQVAYWKGDAYVVEASSDPSVLASIATAVGGVMELSPLLATAMAAGRAEELSMLEPVWERSTPLAGVLLRSVEPRWMVLSPLKAAGLALDVPQHARERLQGLVPALPTADSR